MTHPATRTPARTKNMPAAVYAAVSLVVEEHQAFFIMYLIQFMLSDIYGIIIDSKPIFGGYDMDNVKSIMIPPYPVFRISAFSEFEEGDWHITRKNMEYVL